MVHYATGHCNGDKTRNLNSTLNKRATSIMLPSYRCLYCCTPLQYEFSNPCYLHWKMFHNTLHVIWFAYFNRKNIVGVVFLRETFRYFSFLEFPAHLVYVKSSYCRAENCFSASYLRNRKRQMLFPRHVFNSVGVLLPLCVLIQVIFRTFFSFWSRISKAPFIFRKFVT